MKAGRFFSNFEMVESIKKLLLYDLKILQKYEFSQNLEYVAQKLSPLYPFQSLTSQGRCSLIF